MKDLELINNYFLKYQKDGYDITYRIHPGSNKKIYKKNLFYYSNNNLIDDFNNNEYIFGISSSALVEGLILNKKVIKFTNKILKFFEPIWIKDKVINIANIKKK